LLKSFKADIHIHTCLSPCSDWEMSPKNIVETSVNAGLNLIAICDHNSAENTAAAIREGTKHGLQVLPGIEVCSREEVHILTIFEKIEHTFEMQAYVYANLPGENQPEVFGYQVVANEKDEVLAENPRLLIGATQINLHDIVEKARSMGGLCIASHIDRPAFGLIGQLGFIPPDLALDGVEVSYRVPLEKARENIPGIGDYSCITASDAHFLKDIGKVRTVFIMAEPTVAEIRMALTAKDGRKIRT
jgi:PHP family Zn ribbon phosphoesterase